MHTFRAMIFIDVLGWNFLSPVTYTSPIIFIYLLLFCVGALARQFRLGRYSIYVYCLVLQEASAARITSELFPVYIQRT
jgi:hypothetical protein